MRARNVWQHVEGGSSRRRGPPLDHRQDDPAQQRPSRQQAPRGIDALEERSLRLLELGPPRGKGVESRRRTVVGRDVVPLPALLVEPQPPPARLPEVVRVPTRFVQKYTLRASHLELGGVDLDLAVEDDVLPLDRADVTQQAGVEREVRRRGQP